MANQGHALVEHVISPIHNMANKENALVVRAVASEPITAGSMNASCCVVYLHGFPDTSLHPTIHEYTSRMPRKIAEYVLESIPNGIFLCFNFSGVVGSDSNFDFRDKTVSQEV